MQHPRAANTTSATAGPIGDVVSNGHASGATVDPNLRLGLEPGQARSLALDASRQLRCPLSALRILLEGTRRNNKTQASPFADRAIEEIERAEAAAHDLLAWVMPRNLRSTPATLSEIVESLRAALAPADRRRTHFVLEQENTTLITDAPLLVESFERSLRHLFRDGTSQDIEVMVHVHASADDATFSFIHTGGATLSKPQDDASTLPSIADALLHESVQRLGGKASTHDAEGHRCSVITLPLAGPTQGPKEAGQ